MKRTELAKQEGTWGASSTSIENTVEVKIKFLKPKRFKIKVAASELSLISDGFLKYV